MAAIYGNPQIAIFYEPMPAERELLGKIRQLDERQRAEVVDFVDFLMAKRAQGRTLLEAVDEEGMSDVSLAEVRKRLSTIRESMADTVNEMRDEPME